MPAATMLVRIKPSAPREAHIFRGYVIRKEKGWHELPADVAREAAEEPLSDLGNDTRLLFDVKETEEAKSVAEAEAIKVDPAGTPEKPTKVQPIAVEPEPAPVAGRRPGRR